MRTALLPAMVLVVAMVVAETPLRAVEPSDIAWLSGRNFERALDQPVSVFRDRAELREMLSRLAAVRRTSYVLDRRIDPSSTVSLRLTQVPLLEAFDEAAEQVAATPGQLGSTLFVGSPQDLDRVLTHEAIRKEELKEDRATPSARRVELVRGREIVWRDLDRPIDILDQIARLWGLTIEGREQVPHDLWAGAVAVDVDACEALSLVLGQFDLTFEWLDNSRAVRIVPAGAEATVQRLHRSLSMPRPQAIEEIRRRWPDRAVMASGTALLVSASVLEHREISQLLGEITVRPRAPREPLPLDRRRFPVRVVRKPLVEVLGALREQGIDLHYDAAELTAAGVDVQQLVSLELQNATAEELFQALCRPAGLRFEIDGNRVTITAP